MPRFFVGNSDPEYSRQQIEFMNAMDREKRRLAPREMDAADVLRVAKALGYRPPPEMAIPDELAVSVDKCLIAPYGD